LLPLVLIVAGYFYVTGGTVMSTDNAYVQADMVGLSTDVSGIVREVSVHDNQPVAKGDVLFKLDDLQFRLALNRAEAQLGNTRNDLVALQASYRNVAGPSRAGKERRRLRHGQLQAAAAIDCQQLHAANPPSIRPATRCREPSKSSPR
jgi:multidrug resistance efflux pump